MINANRSELKVDGNGLDITFEINHIISQMYTTNPEMIIGIITAWAELIQNDECNINTAKLDVFFTLSQDWINTCKGHEA